VPENRRSATLSPEFTVSAQWLRSPVDGSGVVVPSITRTLGDRWSLVLRGYLADGAEPLGTTLRSAFGAAPQAAFVQIRTYR